MYLPKSQRSIFAVILALLAVYSVVFYLAGNTEFLFYIGVIVFFFILILYTNEKVRYPDFILWGLVLWAFLHLSGGGIQVGDGVLYRLMLVPLSDTLPIFRYDQFVHIVGFAVATLLAHHLLLPYLKQKKMGFGLGLVIVMAGLGFGALNEIVEFAATLITPETGVGGYINTSLDLVADFIGALIAVSYLKYHS